MHFDAFHLLPCSDATSSIDENGTHEMGVSNCCGEKAISQKFSKGTKRSRRRCNRRLQVRRYLSGACCPWELLLALALGFLFDINMTDLKKFGISLEDDQGSFERMIGHC